MNVDEIILKLSVKEKIKFLTGKNYWETYGNDLVKSKFLSDGPNGLRKQENADDLLGLNQSIKAISYPTACLLACSFDDELLEKIGAMLAKEAKSQNVDMILGPGINIKRSPLGGRNFEYFSEDPYLSGKLASAFVNGLESNGVASCLKHYACNSFEKNRMLANSVIDDRTLNELYLKAFMITIKEANPSSIMTSYNKVNGTYMCENKELMQLARKNGFNGMFITDWGGMDDAVLAFKNGLNLEMPGGDKTRSKMLYKAYKENKISIEEINNAVKPVIEFLLKYDDKSNDNSFDLDEAKKLCLEAASKSIVLLKNDNILPLNKENRIGVIGNFAIKPRICGSGSSKVNPCYSDNFIQILDENKINYDYSSGILDNKLLIDEIKNISLNNDKVVVFLGLDEKQESEGFDKTNIELPDIEINLINEIKKYNSNIIVVLQGGSPVLLPFINEIKGLLTTYLAGASSGEATYNILFGITNPSGRLAETWPKKIEDHLSYDTLFKDEKAFVYSEGLYVGYKYYYAKNIEVNYPFGYGLSYTNFNYTNIEYIDNTISLDITNNGIDGSDVIEVYLDNRDRLNYRRLVAFKKINLLKGETKRVDIKLDDDIFMMYDIAIKKYIKTSGIFYLCLGTSATNIYYEKEINIKGDNPYIVSEIINKPINNMGFSIKFSINSTFKDLKRSKLGNIIYNFAEKKKQKLLNENQENAKMIEASINEMPLRNLSMGTNGKFNYLKIQGLVDLLNGKIKDGIKGLLK